MHFYKHQLSICHLVLWCIGALVLRCFLFYVINRDLEAKIMIWWLNSPHLWQFDNFISCNVVKSPLITLNRKHRSTSAPVHQSTKWQMKRAHVKKTKFEKTKFFFLVFFSFFGFFSEKEIKFWLGFFLQEKSKSKGEKNFFSEKKQEKKFSFFKFVFFLFQKKKIWIWLFFLQ